MALPKTLTDRAEASPPAILDNRERVSAKVEELKITGREGKVITGFRAFDALAEIAADPYAKPGDRIDAAGKLLPYTEIAAPRATTIKGDPAEPVHFVITRFTKDGQKPAVVTSCRTLPDTDQGEN